MIGTAFGVADLRRGPRTRVRRCRRAGRDRALVRHRRRRRRSRLPGLPRSRGPRGAEPTSLDGLTRALARPPLPRRAVAEHASGDPLRPAPRARLRWRSTTRAGALRDRPRVLRAPASSRSCSTRCSDGSATASAVSLPIRASLAASACVAAGPRRQLRRGRDRLLVSLRVDQLREPLHAEHVARRRTAQRPQDSRRASRSAS